MGFLDSIESSVESSIQSKAQSAVTKKIYSVGSTGKQTANQNQQQNSTETAIKVTIEFKDRIVTIAAPAVVQMPNPNGNTNFQIIGKPAVSKKWIAKT